MPSKLGMHRQGVKIVWDVTRNVGCWIETCTHHRDARMVGGTLLQIRMTASKIGLVRDSCVSIKICWIKSAVIDRRLAWEYVGVKTISLSGSISVFAASRLGYTGWRTFCYVYKILTTSVAHTQNVKNQIWHERKNAITWGWMRFSCIERIVSNETSHYHPCCAAICSRAYASIGKSSSSTREKLSSELGWGCSQFFLSIAQGGRFCDLGVGILSCPRSLSIRVIPWTLCLLRRGLRGS